MENATRGLEIIKKKSNGNSKPEKYYNWNSELSRAFESQIGYTRRKEWTEI